MSAPITAACLAAGGCLLPSVSRTPATGPSTRAARIDAKPLTPIGLCARQHRAQQPRDVGVHLAQLALVGVARQALADALPARDDQRVDVAIAERRQAR